MQKGDTLWDISRQYNTTVSAIVKCNNILTPNLIFPGQVFIIPVGNSQCNCNDFNTPLIYYVRKGDNLWNISRKYNTTVNELVKINHIINPDLIYPGEKLIIP